ncbi:GNAT family N-acetyltransferase [uncultured Bifidobacterium sp.]|uniref:GNAT family N-acetyltransferase n=1 Tax=uncultured Bifidobacterium sp. TaxID=165187 RepID=UPI0028DB640A|nr:GNAT family N-acetyltransferase [uncultured Bifidobacterium sp.]
MLRPAEEDDVRGITDVYNEAVAAGGSTADLKPCSVGQRREWMSSHVPRRLYPILVLVQDPGAAPAPREGSRIEGFGSLSRFHPRTGYDGVVELSYYVASRARGRGCGTMIVDRLLHEAVAQGHRMATAIIYADNAASIALMRRFGFTRFGLLPHACVDGRDPGWRTGSPRLADMSYWYRDLRSL